MKWRMILLHVISWSVLIWNRHRQLNCYLITLNVSANFGTFICQSPNKWKTFFGGSFFNLSFNVRSILLRNHRCFFPTHQSLCDFNIQTTTNNEEALSFVFLWELKREEYCEKNYYDCHLCTIKRQVLTTKNC
jgi:hypothetical protein